MKKRTEWEITRTALLAGFLTAILSGCAKEFPAFITIGDGRKMSASETGIPLAVLADTNLVVYAMTGGDDKFPLSPEIKERIISAMSSPDYVPVILNAKMVVMAIIYMEDRTPRQHLVFFDGGLVGLNTETYLVGNDLAKVISILKEGEREYNRAN